MIQNELMAFAFDKGSVQVVMIDGDPWFVAKDVAEILEYSQTNVMIRRLRPRNVMKIKSSLKEGLTNRYGNNDILIINEPALYAAVVHSKKPQAEAFQDWIMEEVLPSIRKTGQYSAVANTLPPTYGELVIEYGKTLVENEKKQALIEAQYPKVESYESLMSASGHISMADAAKIISETVQFTIGRNILIRILRYIKILDEHNMPYQAPVNKGYFKVVASNPNNIGITKTTLVTSKGLDFIRETILGMSEMELGRASGSAGVVKAIARHSRQGKTKPLLTKVSTELETQSEINLS